MSETEEVKPDDFRGFTEDFSSYFLADKTWKIQEVKGRKPKELRDKHRKLEVEAQKAESIMSVYDSLDVQDDFAKDILESYLEGFKYNDIIDSYDPKVLREMAMEIFFILSRTGSNPLEIKRSIKLYKATLKHLSETKTL